MNKLTAEIARMDIGHLREHQANPHVGLSMREEKYLQALEIALPVLEQECGCRWRYDESDHYWSSACGEDWQFTDSGPEENRVKFCHGCGKPVVLTKPSTNPQIDNDEERGDDEAFWDADYD